MSEELAAELAAMRRLVERLAMELRRLGRQFDRVEKTAQRLTTPTRPRSSAARDDDDEGSD